MNGHKEGVNIKLRGRHRPPILSYKKKKNKKNTNQMNKKKHT